jgi:hypothetical protein
LNRCCRIKTVWQAVTIEDWYGEGRREVEIVSDTAVWFHGDTLFALSAPAGALLNIVS